MVKRIGTIGGRAQVAREERSVTKDGLVLAAIAVVSIAFGVGLYEQVGLNIVLAITLGAAGFFVLFSLHYIIVQLSSSESIAPRISSLERVVARLARDMSQVEEISKEVAEFRGTCERIDQAHSQLELGGYGESSQQRDETIRGLSQDVQRIDAQIRSLREYFELSTQENKERMKSELRAVESHVKHITESIKLQAIEPPQEQLPGLPGIQQIPSQNSGQQNASQPFLPPMENAESFPQAPAQDQFFQQQNSGQTPNLPPSLTPNYFGNASSQSQEVEFTPLPPVTPPSQDTQNGAAQQQQQAPQQTLQLQTTQIIPQPGHQPPEVEFTPLPPVTSTGAEMQSSPLPPVTAQTPEMNIQHANGAAGMQQPQGAQQNAAQQQQVQGQPAMQQQPLQQPAQQQAPELEFAPMQQMTPVVSDMQAQQMQSAPLQTSQLQAQQIQAPQLQVPQIQAPQTSQQQNSGLPLQHSQPAPYAPQEQMQVPMEQAPVSQEQMQVQQQQQPPQPQVQSQQQEEAPKSLFFQDLAPNEPSEGETRMLDILHKAISGNRIDLYLQPIVSLPERNVAFYESYTRLRDERDQLFMPQQYMDVAEKHGIMPVVDNVMLFRSIQVARKLIDRGSARGLFCNLSSCSLMDNEFFSEFLGFLDKNKDLANSLYFDIDQAAYGQPGRVGNEKLVALAKLGYKFSIDNVTRLDIDFGELQRQGVRFMKVDSSILLGGMDQAGARIHVADMRSYLKRFDIELVGTKIENDAMLNQLLSYDLKLGQGYLFSEPRPVRPEIFKKGGAAKAA